MKLCEACYDNHEIECFHPNQYPVEWLELVKCHRIILHALANHNQLPTLLLLDAMKAEREALKRALFNMPPQNETQNRVPNASASASDASLKTIQS